MRKLLVASLVSALLVPLSVAPQATAHPTGQEVIETVIAPPLPAKNVSRGGRSLVIISQMLGVNGIGGYYFSPDPDTIGAPFELKPAGVRDVDVFFYADIGTLDGSPQIVGEYATESTTGEKGFVPQGTNLVVVYYGPCVAVCPPTSVPVAVSFLYRAEDTPVVTIDGSGSELGRTEVHAGGAVAFNSTSAEPVTVRSVDLDSGGEFPLFQTDPFSGRLLFDLSALVAGEYAYTASDGSEGTIAIVA